MEIIRSTMRISDLPTQYNSPAYASDGPLLDASTVAILRRNGALIMGKICHNPVYNSGY